MDNLVKILKKDFDFENLNCFDNITELIRENELEKFIDYDIQPIEINNNQYYIITIECDCCGEKFYYIADEKNADKNEIKIYYDFESNSDYNTVCQNCVENEFVHCEECGELVHQDDSIWCEDNYTMYCLDCADEYTFTCEECEGIHSIDNRNITGDEREICNHCIENGEYYYCADCGELYYCDDLIYNENDEADYCRYCYEEHAHYNFDYENAENRDNENIEKSIKDYEDISAITEYHKNPIDFVKRKSNNDKDNEKLFFGVELETSNNSNSYLNEASSFVADNLYCRIENDSSIPNYGFEIISDPMTLRKWHERKSKINQVFNELTNNGFVSHNASGGNCGLHIHASREALGDTEAEQENTINNIILITENFKKELQQFSRRKNFSWCHFFNDDTENNAELNIEKIKKEKQHKGRYQVINISNYKTIEFRLCRGTLKTNTFFASIQLFYNIIQLAKNNNFINATWQDLINMNNFEELQKYNEERQIKSNTTIKVINKKPEPKKEIFQTVIILKNNKDTQKEINYILNQLEDKNIIKLEKQGVKNLAYPINEEKQGYYIIIEHNCNNKQIKYFEQYLNSKSNVLKTLSVKKEV